MLVFAWKCTLYALIVTADFHNVDAISNIQPVLIIYYFQISFNILKMKQVNVKLVLPSPSSIEELMENMELMVNVSLEFPALFLDCFDRVIV